MVKQVTTKLLEGKVALVTGASRGIGAAVAKLYAAHGAHVVLVARKISALEEVDDAIKAFGGNVTLVPLDLKEFDKIDELPKHLAVRFGKLDILVGNAAILGDLRPLTDFTPKMWQEVLAVNLTANWRLLTALHPLLKAAKGTVIFTTSGVTQATFPFYGPYAVSKIALEKMAETYAAEVQTQGIQVKLVDPGVVATAMRKQAFPGEDQNKLATPDQAAEKFLNILIENRKAA